MSCIRLIAWEKSTSVCDRIMSALALDTSSLASSVALRARRTCRMVRRKPIKLTSNPITLARLPQLSARNDRTLSHMEVVYVPNSNMGVKTFSKRPGSFEPRGARPSVPAAYESAESKPVLDSPFDAEVVPGFWCLSVPMNRSQEPIETIEPTTTANATAATVDVRLNVSDCTCGSLVGHRAHEMIRLSTDHTLVRAVLGKRSIPSAAPPA